MLTKADKGGETMWKSRKTPEKPCRLSVSVDLSTLTVINEVYIGLHTHSNLVEDIFG